MGLYILSFGVELAALKRAFASQDAMLLQAVAATDTFHGYASQDSPGAVPTGEALRHILYGEPYHAHSALSYGYALISLCAYLGVDLSERLNEALELKLGYETDLIDEYLVADFAITGIACAEDLLAEVPDFGLPPVADFPASGILSRAEIEDLHQQLAPVTITDEQVAALLDSDSEDDEERGIAYEGIKLLKDRIDYCYQHQLALLSFCHGGPPRHPRTAAVPATGCNGHFHSAKPITTGCGTHLYLEMLVATGCGTRLCLEMLVATGCSARFRLEMPVTTGCGARLRLEMPVTTGCGACFHTKKPVATGCNGLFPWRWFTPEWCDDSQSSYH